MSFKAPKRTGQASEQYQSHCTISCIFPLSLLFLFFVVVLGYLQLQYSFSRL